MFHGRLEHGASTRNDVRFNWIFGHSAYKRRPEGEPTKWQIFSITFDGLLPGVI